MEEDHNALKDKLTSFGQAHLLNYLPRINDKALKESYLNKLQTVDYKLINKLFENFKQQSLTEGLGIQNDITDIKSTYNRGDISTEEELKLREIGYNKISTGKIALLILAGGQGSRLGYNKAKGMYNVAMPSNKTLFQYLVERFLSVQKLSWSNSQIENKKESTLFIMTSVENDAETRQFFLEHNHFGVKVENIVFFPQETIPAINLEGKIINKSAHEIFENPNGNGGCFITMKNHKIIDEFESRGIEYFHVISVDNPLTKVMDPLFVGLNYRNESEIAAKFIGKRDPYEPVGVFVNLNGKATMIDYGAFPKKLAEERNSNGKLRYNTSNILNYIINVKFLSKVLNTPDKYNDLIYQFNYAKKKIDCYNHSTDKDEKVDGIKFELFFHSIFTFAEKEMVLLEVDRNEEFAPIKNSDPAPNDTPKSCRKLMSDLFKRWLGESVTYENFDESNSDASLLEISFLKSYNGENLEDTKGKAIKLPIYLN